MLAYFVAAEQDIIDLIDDALLHDLNPGLLSLDSWLAEHKDDIPHA